MAQIAKCRFEVGQ